MISTVKKLSSWHSAAFKIFLTIIIRIDLEYLFATETNDRKAGKAGDCSHDAKVSPTDDQTILTIDDWKTQRVKYTPFISGHQQILNTFLPPGR